MDRQVWEDIDRSIRAYDKLVAICSEASLTSPGVQDEIERVMDKQAGLVRENAERVTVASEDGVEPKLKDEGVLFPVRINYYALDGWNHHRKSDVTRRTISDFIVWDKDSQTYTSEFDQLLKALDPKSWSALD